jgi:deoxyribonuclease V
LAFREVPAIVDVLTNLRQQHPEYVPQVLLVDGNGILHMRGCGQASHLGVVTNIPTVGVAKKLLVADGINEHRVEEAFRLSKHPDEAVLKGNSGKEIAVVSEGEMNNNNNKKLMK